jgi:hypothetical protein
MPKGVTRPITVVNPMDVEAFVKSRAVNQHKSIAGIPKAKKKDFDYLSGIFETMVSFYDQKGIKDEQVSLNGVNRGRPYRYTPRRMFDNAVAYMRVTIAACQPLTITGLGMFMGIHRKEFFHMLSDTKMREMPEYGFMYDFADFTEMYNEYAAHVKQNPAGPIFILKNFGWKDKFEIEASSTMGALTDEEREVAQKRLAAFSEERIINN